MIGKVTRGSDVGGLLRYLYGPGKVNEHTNAHLVASWGGDDRTVLDPLEPAPGRSRQRFAALSDRLNLPLALLPDVPDRHVWQCSMRLANRDRRLTDLEWAEVAREVMSSTGIAPPGDPGACRWVAVRHAEDHIHIVTILARQDGARVDAFRDWHKVHAAARSIEKRFGLTSVPMPSRTGTINATRAEAEKAQRTGRLEPARAYLAREVRLAARTSYSVTEFAARLTGRPDIVVAWRYSQLNPGQVTGFRVGRAGDVDGSGSQVWFPGSRLSADLSLPKITRRWNQNLAAPASAPVETRARHQNLPGRRGRAGAALIGLAADAVADRETVMRQAVATARNLANIASAARLRS